MPRLLFLCVLVSATFARNRRSLQRDRPRVIDKYELWKPEDIGSTLQKWATHYPNYVRVTTAQEAYGLPPAGSAHDCPYDQGEGCLQYIMTIQDYPAHDETATKRLPAVLWSGELHGNERVGPTAVLEAANLLLQAASCEALGNEEPTLAATCRQDLYDYGIDDVDRQWLARLVATRKIVVVPTANAQGYYRDTREEDEIDPNRDFPYDIVNPHDCMQTIAARTLNEVFRSHIFQLALTFHAGMEIVAYEWGATSWKGYYSPDHEAQTVIGAAYSRYGGSFASSPAYASDTMNDQVYPVEGGMEDWAYAASWDPERVVACDPQTKGGYPPERTTYDNSTLRCFNMLIETSDHKVPKELGTSEGVMFSDAAGNGHVSRNIRLALLAAEMVEPYVQFTNIDGLRPSDDVVPSVSHERKRSCKTTTGVRLDREHASVRIEWLVGGALQVDNTKLYFAKWDDVESGVNCWSQPSTQTIESTFHEATMTSDTTGYGEFSNQEDYTTFSATLELSDYNVGDEILIMAAAMVDQNWKMQPDNIGPNVPPQSHIVNARTDPTWYHENEGSVVQGRLEWFSRPYTIVIADSVLNTVEELQIRYTPPPPTPAPTEDPNAFVPTAPAKENDDPESRNLAPIIALAFALIIAGCCLWRGSQSYFRTSKRGTVRDFIDDETKRSPGLDGYSDHDESENSQYSDEPGVELGDRYT